MAHTIRLNEDDVFSISQNSHDASIAIVKEKFDCDYRTVSDILRNRILYDSLLEQINFCLVKGFTLKECVLFASYFNNLIQYLKKNPNTKLDQFLIYVGRSIGEFNNIESRKIKQLLNYLNDTLFIHFDLYKYVFTHERDAMVREEDRVVNCPPKENFQNQTLSSAKPYHIWDYESKLKVIENREKELDNKFLERRIRLAQEEHSLKNSNTKSSEGNDELNEVELAKLIDAISAPILNTTLTLLKSEAEEVKENILIALEKTMIPRPDELGALPPIVSKMFKTSETSKLATTEQRPKTSIGKSSSGRKSSKSAKPK